MILDGFVYVHTHTRVYSVKKLSLEILFWYGFCIACDFHAFMFSTCLNISSFVLC
jgi:hypothetical protein